MNGAEVGRIYSVDSLGKLVAKQRDSSHTYGLLVCILVLLCTENDTCIKWISLVDTILITLIGVESIQVIRFESIHGDIFYSELLAAYNFLEQVERSAKVIYFGSLLSQILLEKFLSPKGFTRSVTLLTPLVFAL